MNCFSLSVLFLGVAAGLVAGCGGGQSGSENPPQGNVTISAITGPDHLQIGVNSPATYVYSATVNGSSDTAVVWSVSDSSLATIAASTGVATPSATNKGMVTITAAAHADPTKTATLQVNVVDWILADYDAYLLNGGRGAYGSLLPTIDSYEECSWSTDHLEFICSNGTTETPTAFYIFKTNGTTAGTTLIGTINLPTANGLLFASYPRFSPDGSNIVFLGSQSTGLSVELGPFIVGTSGTAAPKLIATDPDFFDPTFSSPRYTPDGSEILYAQLTGLWIVNVDGSNPHMLVPALAGQGLFSPDMSTLYYASNGCIYKANIDGNNPVCIYSGDVDELMDISPNGKSLVYAGPEVISPTGGNIYTVNSDGSNPQQTRGLDFASW